MNLPIIRLEIEGMKHAICTAITEHNIQMDAYVQKAMNEYFSEANIQALVAKSVARCMSAIIESCVEYHVRYGEGNQHIRKIIADAIRKSAEEQS